MKRFHVHVGVADLAQSIRFYSTLFAAAPTVRKPDYAKWMLDEPRVNFAISKDHGDTGIHHLGIQVEDEAELRDVYDRLAAAERPVLEEGKTECCYARSEKAWISDPQGIAWETFLTFGESTVYGGNAPARGSLQEAPALQAASGCCGPAQPEEAERGCGCGAAAE